MGRSNFAMPDDQVKKWWGHCPSHVRLTFLATFLAGLACHLYMLTNKLPNHDDAFHTFEFDYGCQSGRWLLPYMTSLSGDFSMPWLIGLISLVCLALSACLVVYLLDIQQPVCCILTGVLMVSFPTVASTFTYMFTADAYFIGVLLAVLGAFLAVRSPYVGSLLGIVALILSMSIYQAYFPLAVALMVGALLIEVLKGEKGALLIVGKGLRLVAVLGIAMVGYLMSVKITTYHVGLVDYMGISSMGQLDLADLPLLVKMCYQECYAFFMEEGVGIAFEMLQPILLVALISTVLLLLLLLMRPALRPLHKILAVVLVVLYPLASSLIYIMIGGNYIHLLMQYGLVSMLLLPLALVSFATTYGELGRLGRGLQAALSWIIILTLAVTGYSYILCDNEAYFKMQMSYTQCEAYGNRLIAKIEGTEGYEPNMPLVLLGSTSKLDVLPEVEAFEDVDYMGATSMSNMRRNYSFGYFLKNYLGLTNEYVAIDRSEMANHILTFPEVEMMPCYPAEGSIRVIDGAMVVKFN